MGLMVRLRRDEIQKKKTGGALQHHRFEVGIPKEEEEKPRKRTVQ